jgi:hypothetical protein
VSAPDPITPENRELFADFGEVMYEIQLFEMTLQGLVDAQPYRSELRGTPSERGTLSVCSR